MHIKHILKSFLRDTHTPILAKLEFPGNNHRSSQ